MAPHTWSHLGDTVSDTTHHMYYRGQRIKEAYYRGECIWRENEIPKVVWHDTFFLDFTGRTSKTFTVWLDLRHYSQLIVSWGDGTWEYVPKETGYSEGMSFYETHTSHTYKDANEYRVSIHALTYNQWIWPTGTKNGVYGGVLYLQKYANIHGTDDPLVQMAQVMSANYTGSWYNLTNDYTDRTCIVGAFLNTHVYHLFGMFINDTSLREVSVINAVNTSGYGSYNNYAKARHAVIYSQNLTNFQNSAFADCSGLQRIVIGSNMTSIAPSAFWVSSTNKTKSNDNLVEFTNYSTKLQYIGDSAFYNMNIHGDFDLGSNMRYVGPYAFNRNSLDIRGFSFGSSSELYIGEKAFDDAFYFPPESTPQYALLSFYTFRIPNKIKMVNPYSFANLPPVGKVMFDSPIKTVYTTEWKDDIIYPKAVFYPANGLNIDVPGLMYKDDYTYSNTIRALNFKTAGGNNIFSDKIARDESGYRYVSMGGVEYSDVQGLLNNCNAESVWINGQGSTLYPLATSDEMLYGFRGKEITIKGFKVIRQSRGGIDGMNCERLNLDAEYISLGMEDFNYWWIQHGFKNRCLITLGESLKGIFATSVDKSGGNDVSSTCRPTFNKSYGYGWTKSRMFGVRIPGANSIIAHANFYQNTLDELNMASVTSEWNYPEIPDDVGHTYIIEGSPFGIFVGQEYKYNYFGEIWKNDQYMAENGSDENTRATFAHYMDEWADFLYLIFLSYPMDRMYIKRYDEFVTHPLWGRMIRRHPTKVFPYTEYTAEE